MDLISRQAAIDAMLKLQAEDDEMYGCRIPEGFDGDRAKGALEQVPPAQPEIIRCKDCIYYRQEIDMCDEPCSTAHNIVHEDDYCSRAERRQE